MRSPEAVEAVVGCGGLPILASLLGPAGTPAVSVHAHVLDALSKTLSHQGGGAHACEALR